ncbi:MAG: hypothetical protein V1929_07355 [bacterium]
MGKWDKRIPRIGKTWAALILVCSCLGCATYMAEQQPARTKVLEDKLAQTEWRIILFRWPPDYHAVIDGVTNKSSRLFIPYIQGLDPEDGLRHALPRDAGSGN